MAFLQPDRYFARITRIDVQRDLLDQGLTHVLLDIDNTIRSRETGDIPADVQGWLTRARRAGVQFCLLSNNWHDNVFGFARDINLPLVAKACKPLPLGYLRALRKIGGTRQTTVVIGDQLSTDIVGAHAVGLRAFLLMPLVEKDLRHTVVVRKFERRLLGDRAPE